MIPFSLRITTISNASLCRGSDVNYNPVFYSYAIVTLDSSTLFVDESKLDNEVVVIFRT